MDVTSSAPHIAATPRQATASDRRRVLGWLDTLAGSAEAVCAIESPSVRWPSTAPDGRHMDVRLDGPAPTTARDTARVIAGLIDHPSLSVSAIDNVGGLARLRCAYRGEAGPWIVDVTVRIAA